MRRSWLRLCVGTSFVGAALVMGCGHSRHCKTCGSAKTNAPPMAVAVVEEPGSGSNYAAVPQPPAIDTKIVEAPKAPEAVEEKNVEQTSLVKVLPEPPEHAKRRTFRDISADPCFAHAPDYSSVTGELYHYKQTNVWTVRYATTDEDDKYGGSVTLTDVGSMEGYASGQMVNVEGRMVDPDSTEARPQYKVQAMHALKR